MQVECFELKVSGDCDGVQLRFDCVKEKISKYLDDIRNEENYSRKYASRVHTLKVASKVGFVAAPFTEHFVCYTNIFSVRFYNFVSPLRSCELRECYVDDSLSTSGVDLEHKRKGKSGQRGCAIPSAIAIDENRIGEKENENSFWFKAIKTSEVKSIKALQRGR